MQSTATPRIRSALLLLTLPSLIALGAPGHGASAPRWGRDGHVLSGLAAATNLPAAMPQFFRDARAQLGYLSYEPDRWREGRMTELNEAFQYDHFLDLEMVPAQALQAQDRFEYLLAMSRAGVPDPQSAGFVHFRIVEVFQRLQVEFRLWRNETNPDDKRFIEARIINDAGILAHYVEDAANPHHATIHYNGWNADAPNPNGYTLDRTFHRRFESDFVGAKVRVDDLIPGLRDPRVVDDVRAAVIAQIRTSNAAVTRLYDLEKLEAFGASTASAAHKAFAVERLSAGVDMVRSLWWTAWVKSGQP